MLTAPIQSFFCSFDCTAFSINKNTLFSKTGRVNLLMQGLVNATTACALSILSIILSKSLTNRLTGRFRNNTKKAVRLFTNVAIAFLIKKKEALFAQNLANKIFTASLLQWSTKLDRPLYLVQDFVNLNLTDLVPLILKVSSVFTKVSSFLDRLINIIGPLSILFLWIVFVHLLLFNWIHHHFFRR